MPASTHPRGVIAILSVLGVSLFALAVITSVTVRAQGELTSTATEVSTERTLAAAETGLNEGLYRLTANPGAQTFCLDTTGVGIPCSGTGDEVTVAITIDTSDPLQQRRIIESTARAFGNVRSLHLVAQTNAFGGNVQYAVQSGPGGVEADNNSEIHGPLYANGPIIGQMSGNPKMFGETWSTASLWGVTVGDAATPEAENAHAPSISNTTVISPGQALIENPPTTSYPFTAAQVAAWKDQADDVTTTGNVTIASDTSMGPRKIIGNLTVQNGRTLTLTGPVWVTGTIDTDTHAVIQAVQDVTNAASVQLMTDSSMVVKNHTTLQGSGHPNSFLLIASLKNDHASPAITGENNSTSVVYFAPDGVIQVAPNALLNNTTGWLIQLQNRSVVQYNPNLSGFYVPGGTPQPIGAISGTWQEQ